jgi:HSP20 family protein
LRWLLEQHHGDIPVEEYVEDGDLVVRAEIPGTDPDTDVALALDDDRIRIRVDRRARHRTHEQHAYRSEIRYGSFVRTLPLPVDVKADGVKATSADGILTIRLPVADEPAGATKIPINRG